MITVKVTYGVRKEYVEINKKMIAAFLSDFRKLASTEFTYSVYQEEGNQTFVHLSQFANKNIQDTVLQIPSFLAFQTSRDKNISIAHRVAILRPIGTTKTD